MNTQTRVLPADVYDALELSAEAFGGIGAGRFGDPKNFDCPLCIYGHADFLDSGSPYGRAGALNEALGNAGITINANDTAVRRATGHMPGSGARITFAQWCQALGVERGR